MKRAFAAIVMLLVPAAVAAVEVREAHYVMGTLLEITLEAPDRATGQRWIRSGVAEARRLDAELTSWDPASPLSQLNAAAGLGARDVPADLFRLVERSLELSRATGGTFDVSVAPLLHLWREAAEQDRWPSPAVLRHSRERVGYERVRLRSPNGIALGEGMGLDVGGIGKGYAVDRIASLLEARGVRRALINFGGSSMRAMGGAPAWKVWVRVGARLEGPIVLADRALSTSASGSRGRAIAGRTVGDLIDPRSGVPVDEDRVATIVGPLATDAEAWSTAMVVDPERTRASLRQHPDYQVRFRRSAEDEGGA